MKENRKKYSDDKRAIKEAVESCISDGILEDYLKKRRGEIADMIMYDMTIEEMIGTAEENREEGREEGIIETCKDVGISFSGTVERVARSFHLSIEEAEERVRRRW